MHQNLVTQQMPGSPQGQPRLPNQQPFKPNQRPMRIPQYQPPNYHPMYSSPPGGPPVAVQMIGPPGTAQFVPPGQHPPFMTQPVDFSLPMGSSAQWQYHHQQQPMQGQFTPVSGLSQPQGSPYFQPTGTAQPTPPMYIVRFPPGNMPQYQTQIFEPRVRERKIIQVKDPNSNKDVTQEILNRQPSESLTGGTGGTPNNVTPDSSGQSSSSSTPPLTLQQQAEASVGAQFAAQFAATLANSEDKPKRPDATTSAKDIIPNVRVKIFTVDELRKKEAQQISLAAAGEVKPDRKEEPEVTAKPVSDVMPVTETKILNGPVALTNEETDRTEEVVTFDSQPVADAPPVQTNVAETTEPTESAGEVPVDQQVTETKVSFQHTEESEDLPSVLKVEDAVASEKVNGLDANVNTTTAAPKNAVDAHATEISRGLKELDEERREVPLDIQARGPVAVEAYNRAVLDGKTSTKRVPIMLIGQDRTGKTSLKKSLKGEKFNVKEPSTVGIDTDPNYFHISTEAWRTGEKDNVKEPISEVLFERHVAKYICGELKNIEKLPVGVQTSPSQPFIEPCRSSTESLLTESKVSAKRHSRPFKEKVPDSGASSLETTLQNVESISTTEPLLIDVRERAKSLSHPLEEKVPDSIATLVARMLQEDEKAQEENEIFSIIWDFGGQSVYYATHPIFLTQSAIYILACDLSRNPYKKADTVVRQGLYKTHEDSCCNKTNLDYLDFWLSSVYSLVDPDAFGQDTCPSEATTARLPPVFFVCTHADEPYRSATDPRGLALDIFGFLRTKPYKSHLFEDVFVVDNTKSGSENECPEVVRLREKLRSVAQSLPQAREAIPLKWLRFEHILRVLRENHYKWMPINEARQIATDNCGIYDEEQFKTMLNFMHDQKILIHFNKTPELNNTLILDPQWLINIFKEVITVKRYEPTEGIVEEFLLKLQDTGILDERLLDHKWKSVIDMYSKDTCKRLIAIMERFSLLCPWPSDGEHKQYLVPSMLMSPPTDNVVELLSSVRIPSLFVRFDLGRVPPGLFTRLVLQFYQWCNDEWKSQIQPHLFSNFARFHILPDQGVSVIIMCHSSSIEIILHDGSDFCGAMEEDFIDDYSNLATSRAIHWQLRLILECMRREFNWLKHMRYEMCVCCPVCSQKDPLRCRTHDVRGCECLHLLSESDLQKCQYCTRPGFRGDCRIRIKMFAPWFSFTVPEESRNLVGQRQGASGCEVGELRSCITYQEEKSLALPHDVLQCIQTQSKTPKEIVVQFQECLQLTPAELENPERGTHRWIRCLANEAKSQNRIDVIEYLRTIAPAGTTGGEEWKQLAESFGMSYNEIRFLDKRTTNPCDVVLDLMAKHRFLMVGELYDRLVMSGLPGSADLL